MELARLRKKIDKIDNELIKNLTKRQDISRKIGLCKKKFNINIYDKTREEEIISSKKRLAKKSGLSSDFAAKLFRVIINESKKIQKSKNHK